MALVPISFQTVIKYGKLSALGIGITHVTHYGIHWIVHSRFCPHFYRKYHDSHHLRYAKLFLRPAGSYEGGEGFAYIFPIFLIASLGWVLKKKFL